MADFNAGLLPTIELADARRGKTLYSFVGLTKTAVEAGFESLTNPLPSSGVFQPSNVQPVPPMTERSAMFPSAMSAGAHFFEAAHVLPRDNALGNIFATTTIPTFVHNAYRRNTLTWSAFVNNAGQGTSMLNLPSFPATILKQATLSGISYQVETIGPPVVDSEIEFSFSDGGPLFTIEVPVSFRRVTLFAITPPELPYRERLSFLTDIQPSSNDTEKRVSLRRDPRQSFIFQTGVEDGRERNRLENILFARQGESFGIPVWHEASLLSQDTASGATVINVDSTAFSDFRTEGFVVVYKDGDTFDVVQSNVINATSIEISPALTNSYDANTRVMPLRLCQMIGRSSGRRYRRGLSFFEFTFRVLDNDSVVVPSGAGFSSYDGKVLIDDCNYIQTTNEEEWGRPLIVIDNQVGAVFQASLANISRHVSQRTFWRKGKEEIWQLRQLLHLLRGRQVSFFHPTDLDELEVTADLILSSNTLQVRNNGYSQSVQSRSPRNVLRISFKDSTPTLLREIVSSIEDDAQTETFTLDDVWPSTQLVSNIQRVDFIEKVRLGNDDLDFEYQVGSAGSVARLDTPVTTVLE